LNADINQDGVVNSSYLDEDVTVAEGLALVLGAGEEALRLAESSNLQVYCLEPDATKADKLRRRLDAEKLYGVQIAARDVKSGDWVYGETLVDMAEEAMKK
jgi:arginine utilization protein RocB